MLTFNKSLEWAQAIKPQPGFMSLAYEVRLKIYRLVIDDFDLRQIFNDTPKEIEPRKKGKKFCSWSWTDPAGGTFIYP
jgi:hypothetical protein